MMIKRRMMIIIGMVVGSQAKAHLLLPTFLVILSINLLDPKQDPPTTSIHHQHTNLLLHQILLFLPFHHHPSIIGMSPYRP